MGIAHPTWGRRGWDSNPRGACAPNRFRVCRIRPTLPPLQLLFYYTSTDTETEFFRKNLDLKSLKQRMARLVKI